VAKITNVPNPDRLSILAATILLAYVSTRIVNLPAREINFRLFGLILSIEINLRTVIALLVAGLSATGADWLIRSHPALGNRSTLEHWLLPALTAWVIGVPLYRLPFGWEWLLSLIIGGALIMLVLVSEYIVVDPNDARYSLATSGITALSFALFLMLAITLRMAGIRLLAVLPALSLAGGFIALRTLHLHHQERWAFWQATALTLIIAQFTASLHYLPLSPITFSMVLTGPTYALISMVGNLMEGNKLRQAIIEPLIVLTIIWVTAIWMNWNPI
jgi:hypothetical protein